MQFTDLPDAFLQRVLATQDLRLRCTLACTCKQLRRLSLDSFVWNKIELDAGRLQRKGSSAVAAMLHFLTKRTTKETRLTLKCPLPPLDPYRPCLPDANEWPRLSVVPLLMGTGINVGLAGLSLDMNDISLPVQTEILGILPWMSTLKELEVQNICMAEADQLGALNKISSLKKLSLEFDPQAAARLRQSLQGGFPEKLIALTCLTDLRIRRAGYLGSLPEAFGSLANLRSLDLSDSSTVAGIPQSFSRLTALTSVRVEHVGSSDLSGLAWLPSLQALHLNGSRMPIELSGCSRLSALTLLLGNVPEHQIELGFSRMLGYVAQAEEWQALLPQRQQLAPQLGQQLRRLAIADTKLGSVPQAITQLPNLEHLSLTHCSLFDLPEGPYISNLRTLLLRTNFFTEVPQSLKGAAPELQELDLSYNLLRPSETDIETVLQLPKLGHLWVTKEVLQPGSEYFRQKLSNWTAYSMDCLFKLAARHASQHAGAALNVHIFQPRPLEL